MVVSLNPKPTIEQFEKLLSTVVGSLKRESQNDKEFYATLLGTKLEDEVVRVLSENAVGTPFEGSIEKISGQRFPDIVAKQYYGVEVKTTKYDHWRSIGSSVAEGTRTDCVERIYMLFGKMASPVDFICKPYEQCLSEVVVTHSPRYQIDMNLKDGETIFDKIGISYDELRKNSDPITQVLNYYREKLSDSNTSTWWSLKGNDIGAKMVVRMWNQLDQIEQDDIRLKAFCLFPELISRSPNKYNRIAIWLSIRQSVICPNIRDVFSAGGRQLYLSGIDECRVPKVISHLIANIAKVEIILKGIEVVEFEEYWPSFKSDSNLYEQWKDLILENISSDYSDIFIHNFEKYKCKI